MTTRRLAAIVIADVAGYSRLMHADEEGTHARFIALMANIIEPAIARYSGRVVKSTGDGFLAEFPSAVEAVKCAFQFQMGIPRDTTEEHEGRQLAFRVGIHLGDVILEDGDIYGDGVNIAARLEALAEPGGIVVSDVVHENVRGRVSCAFEDMGDQTVKNIARPVRTYRVVAESEQHPSDRLPPLPDKPSIAVLPFQNMSGDPGQDYFVDGMTEEIITALSRVPSFFVVARNSTFAYKGTSPNIRQVGRELGVRYVLEGSVRKSGERVRITGQLADTASGRHVWADRFDGVLTDIFELQDHIAARIIGAIEPKLRDAEIERSRRKPAENLKAYDLVLRGRFAFNQHTRESIEEACTLLRRALEIDPGYSLAAVLLTRCHWNLISQMLHFPSDAEVASLAQMAKTAIEQSRDDPEVLALSALIVALPGGDLDEGISLVDQSLTLNPHSAEAWAIRGMLRAYRNDVQAALDDLEKSRNLFPLQLWVPYQSFGFALAHFVAGRYEDAWTWNERGLRRSAPDMVDFRYGAAALGLLGRTDAAGQLVQKMLARNPDLTLSRVRYFVDFVMKHPFRKPGVADALHEGLRRAGLPE